MPLISIHDHLKHSFPESNKEDWARAASLEVQGKNPFDVLSWKTKDGIKLFPYYDRGDSEKNDYLKNFQFAPSDNPYTGAREWVSMPIVAVVDEEHANTAALHVLATGGDGVLFDLRNRDEINLEVLLHNINWPYCVVSFLVTSREAFVEALLDFVQKNKIDPALLAGTLYGQNANEDPTAPTLALSSFTKFKTLGVYIASSSPVQEIAEALAAATTLMDRITENGIAKETVWRTISVSIEVGTDFFQDIAKLKALRMLWYQVAGAFDLKNYQPSMLEIRAVSKPWINAAFQPHGNMLHSTSAALAAILGGCNVLSVHAEDEANGMMNRIANNISNLMREESHLDKVADAIAGSYALETITDQLANAAWHEFKRKIKTS